VFSTYNQWLCNLRIAGTATKMISRPVPPESEDEPVFTPLSADEARQWRKRNPQVSPLWIVGGQVVVGVLGACVAWAVTANWGVGWSVLYGACAVAVPAGLYARALARGIGASFLLWELVKIGLSVALLAAAPKLVPGLSWLALLVGVVLATQMYWVALAVTRARRQNGN
jgi:ATP synthase protein I